MIEYFDNYNIAVIDDIRFRRDKKTGYFLSSKKIGSGRKRLHVYVWEKYNGAVPKGYHVHHKDEDKLNNNIDNLLLIERKKHIELHGRNLSEAERQRRIQNIINKGVPAAKAWHGSEEGFKWHSKHAKETMSKRQPILYRCTYCEKEFTSKHIYGKESNHFCSNNCKAAFRRKSGIDNITKICESCGKEYVSNKYASTKYCEDCKNRKGYPRGCIQHGS